MSSDIITNIILVCGTILGTIAGALLTIFVPLIVKSYKRKRLLRVVPTISIWNNCRDNIDARLKRESAQWFMNIENMKQYQNTRCFYIVLRSDTIGKMLETKVRVETLSEDSYLGVSENSKTYSVGVISADFKSLIPVPFDSNRTSIHCIITYTTEIDERLQYEMDFEIDKDTKKIKNREDKLFLITYSKTKHQNRKKLLRKFDINLTESFRSSEIAKLLINGATLNFKEGGEDNGNIN